MSEIALALFARTVRLGFLRAMATALFGQSHESLRSAALA